MAWPFEIPPPSFDTGAATLPASVTTAPNFVGPTAYIHGFWFCNATGTAVQVTLQNTGGTKYLDAVNIAPHSTFFSPPLGYCPMVGVRWFANTASGVTGQVWGYQ